MDFYNEICVLIVIGTKDCFLSSLIFLSLFLGARHLVRYVQVPSHSEVATVHHLTVSVGFFIGEYFLRTLELCNA